MDRDQILTASALDPEEEVQFQVAAAPPPAEVQFDEGNVLRPPNPERPIWFSNRDNPATSREGLGVWFRGGTAYKIYGTQNTMDRVVRDLATARAAALPIGNANSAAGLVAQARPPNYRARAGFVVTTVDYRAPWQWFDAQRNGIANFRTLINGISNRPALQRIQAGLQIAVRLKLADPQGFINVNDNNPIQFIDIHYGNDTSVGQLLEIVNQRLAALP